MKILLVEDYQHTRKTIAYGLKSKMSDVEIYESDNGLAAFNFIKDGNFVDVILMDISMPIMNGIEASKKIKEINPEIKIIMLTSFNEKEHVFSSFNSGANAYCLKSIKIDELVSVIKSVMNGALWIDPSIAQYILQLFKAEPVIEESVEENIIQDFDLTAREKDILKLVALGKSNKDIAEDLVLSIHTVKNHLKNILHKMSVEDRTQAAILAIKENLV